MVRGLGIPPAEVPWAARLTDGLSDCSGLRSGRSERGGAVSGAMASGECSRRGLPTAGCGRVPDSGERRSMSEDLTTQGFRGPQFWLCLILFLKSLSW